MTPPKITLGISCKNSERNIGRMLYSILNLNYPKDFLRIVIVDGGSNDRTLQIINDTLANGEIPYSILSGRQFTLGYSRKTVVEHSETELIAFVDDDNELHPFFMANLVKIMESNHRIAGVKATNQWLFPESLAGRLESYKKTLDSNCDTTNLKPEEFTLGGTLMRRKAILEAGNFDSAFTLSCEDRDLALRIADNGWLFVRSAKALMRHYPRSSWATLFKQYRNWARGERQFYRKRETSFPWVGFLLNSLVGFAVSVKYVFITFGTKSDVSCVLLPFEVIFTTAAYFLGLI